MPYKISQRVSYDGVEKLTPGLNDRGIETPDPTPMAPPLGYNKQPSMMENIRNLVRSEALRQAAEAAGAETFDEADDFDVGDDFEPASPYEEVFDPILGGTYDPQFPQRVRDLAEQARQAEAAAPQPPTPVPPAEGPVTPAPAPAASPAPQAPPSKS